MLSDYKHRAVHLTLQDHLKAARGKLAELGNAAASFSCANLRGQITAYENALALLGYSEGETNSD